MKFVDKILGRTKSMSRQMEKAQESIAFAEAGYSEIAKKEERAQQQASRKLLVVGNESIFSSNVINYAIEMANRMSYEIVALNTAPLSCDSFKVLSTSQKKLCQEFKAISEEQAMKFRQVAEEHGLLFTHVVKYSDHDRAVEDVQRENANIEFVISDMQPEINIEDEQSRTVDRPSQQVYVYSTL